MTFRIVTMAYISYTVVGISVLTISILKASSLSDPSRGSGDVEGRPGRCSEALTLLVVETTAQWLWCQITNIDSVV